MCAIFGYLLKSESERVPERLLAAMGEVLKHRGPDDHGLYLDHNVGFGAQRLSILDVEGGHQPLCNEDRTVWAVLNGEIYNYPELKELLLQKGHRFTTGTDTEAVVHAYEEFGEEFPAHLRGMFAVALFDDTRRRFYLVRDRLGIKPLFYAETASGLAFASEAKALFVIPGMPRELNLPALPLLFHLQYVPAPGTVFKDVKKLMPGQMLRWENGGHTLKRYWELPDPVSGSWRAPTLDEAAEELRALLQESVAIHLQSDVPLGAFLSGGVDSSALVAFMARETAEPVKTFTVGFRGPGGDSELPWAREVARVLQTDHAELSVGPEEATAFFEDFIWFMDDLVLDPALIPTHAMSRLARQKVKVALSGEGGDELFGGYRRYGCDLLSPWARRLPAWLRSYGLEKPLRALPHTRRILQALGALGQEQPLARHLAWVAACTAADQEALFSPEARGQWQDGFLEKIFGNYFTVGRDAFQQMQRADLKTWLPDDLLAKVDRMSMAVSLEARVPYLDHRLVEFAYLLPSRLKVGDRPWGGGKAVLKRALRDVLPAPILKRKKQGFEPPLSAWFRRELKGLALETLFSDPFRKRGYFNQA